MSSLKSSTSSTSSTKSGVNKKQGNNIPRGSAVCTLSNKLVFLAEEKTPEPEVFVTDGDRTEKKGRAKEMWTSWSDQWYKNENEKKEKGIPHNLYMFSGKLKVPTEVPTEGKGSAYVTYDRLACARAMLSHALVKSWIWKGLSNAETIKDKIESLSNEKGKPDKAARKAYATKAIKIVSDNELSEFVNMCERFTIWCLQGSEKEDGQPGVPHLLTEMVMGSIKEGSDAMTTAVDEAFEEACIDKTFARVNLKYKGLVEYTSRGRISCTAAFLLQIPKETMTQWLLEEERKRKEESNWFCAHAWYAYLPDINEAGMDKVKERHETQNRRWVSLEDARQLLDAKNLGILEHVLANIK
jgi:hypothetical protein